MIPEKPRVCHQDPVCPFGLLYTALPSCWVAKDLLSAMWMVEGAGVVIARADITVSQCAHLCVPTLVQALLHSKFLAVFF